MDLSRDTYTKANEQDTRGMTFDLLTGIDKKLDNLTACYATHKTTCDERFKKIENRKKLDTAISGGTGIVGGFLAQIAGLFK